MSVLRKFALALVMFCFAVAGVATPAAAIVRPGDAAAMHRLYNPYTGEHFYTGHVAEVCMLVVEGWEYEGLGWVAPMVSLTPVYRLYNPYAGDHHYTTSSFERDHLIEVGWNDEGIGWYSDDTHSVPVYRQYNPYAEVGTHNYTTSAYERDSLVDIGWRDEGVGWYAIG